MYMLEKHQKDIVRSTCEFVGFARYQVMRMDVW